MCSFVGSYVGLFALSSLGRRRLQLTRSFDTRWLFSPVSFSFPFFFAFLPFRQLLDRAISCMLLVPVQVYLLFRPAGSEIWVMHRGSQTRGLR